MKKTFVTLVLTAGLLVSFSAFPAGKYQSDDILINRDWKYIEGDIPDGKSVSYDDRTWESIGLPHSFSIPYFMESYFYTGYGWYRKHLNFKKEDLKKEIFLVFDGIFQEAEIYVNNKKSATHIGGYTGFKVNITDLVHQGDNLIAIRVNNLWRPNVAPHGGGHIFCGGIYRNVHLVKKSASHIDWNGICITTPGLEANQGHSSHVNIVTTLCNLTAVSQEFRLVSSIVDNKGKTVATVESRKVINAQSKTDVEQKSEEIQQPQLWDTQHPNLYKVVSKLYCGRKLVDKKETTFGFRWFKWTADKGFFLNGQHLYIHGANVHQDHAGWAIGITDSATYRDVKMMKEAGFNFIRGSHYPHSPAFSKACDELGMLFWSEAPIWGGGYNIGGFWDAIAYPLEEENKADFDNSALQQLEEMIHIHKNHPSIVVWSMCNEAFFCAETTFPNVKNLLKKMVAASHRLDPTRPAAIGGCQRPFGKDRIDLLGDIAGYNGDGASIKCFQNPGHPNIVSEYGSITSDRPGDFDPGWSHLKPNDTWKGVPWRCGHIIWSGFDYGCVAGIALAKMGIVDHFRIPKRSWFWYRENYGGKPAPEWAKPGVPAALSFKASKTKNILTDGTDDVHLMVLVNDKQGVNISNSPVVTLEIVEGPGEFPTGKSITFSPESLIRIQDGKAAIEVRSYYAGTTTIKASSEGLTPAYIKLEFVGKNKYKHGLSQETQKREYHPEKYANVVSSMTMGANNPTYASSSLNDHQPELAGDNDKNTYWSPGKEDAQPTLTLDTEKDMIVTGVYLKFPVKDNYQFIIEGSVDKKEWKKIEGSVGSQEELLEFNKTKIVQSQTSRFVRVRFLKGSPAAISEIRVKGNIGNPVKLFQ